MNGKGRRKTFKQEDYIMKKFKSKWVTNILAVIELAVLLALCGYLGTLTACLMGTHCESDNQVITEITQQKEGNDYE